MRVLSGIQPSGDYLHVGNYFGALRQFVALQEQHEMLLFIADYHSMNTVRDSKLRRAYTSSVALDYLACGIDPQRAMLFRQSDLPEVTELSWLLSTVTPMGLLERAHAYKDKVAQGQPADHGLFAYPVLQAADILIYRSELVPVGPGPEAAHRGWRATSRSASTTPTAKTCSCCPSPSSPRRWPWCRAPTGAR